MQIAVWGGFWGFGTSGAEDCACRWMFWEDSWLRTSLALTWLCREFEGLGIWGLSLGWGFLL